MKRSIALTLAVLALSLILISGCTSNAPAGTTGTGTPVVSATTSPSSTFGGNLPGQSEVLALKNGTGVVNASIEEISVDRSDSGAHKINIYVNARNAGKDPVQLHWYSRITGADDVSFGGVGVSHDGSGAESAPLGPGQANTVRDYVVIDSDKEYAALSQGAVLEVFMTTEPLKSESPVSFTAAWSLSPAIFT
jgi:hypothetical protein